MQSPTDRNDAQLAVFPQVNAPAIMASASSILTKNLSLTQIVNLLPTTMKNRAAVIMQDGTLSEGRKRQRLTYLLQTTDTGLDKAINEYLAVADWLASLNSVDTHDGYRTQIGEFFGWLNLIDRKSRSLQPITPDDLVAETIAAGAQGNLEIKQTCMKYLLHLKKVAKKSVDKGIRGEISVNSVGPMMNAVKAFLDYNEITTTWWKKKIKSSLPPKVKNTKRRSYRLPEMEKMMDLGDPFDRQNIVLFVAGGERVGGQEGLTMRNIIRLPEGMGILDVYPDSERWHYQVPLNKEAMSYIDELTAYRQSMGERITPDSPLIRNKCKPLSRDVNRPRAIKRDSIRRRMRRLAKMAGVPLDEIQPDHSFRYYFDTALSNSDCKWEIKELMMGHSPHLSKSYYDKSDPQSSKKLLVEYMKGMDALTITPKFKMTKRIAELEKQVENSPKMEVLQNSLLDARMENDALKKKMEKNKTENDEKFAFLQKQMQDIADAQASHWNPDRKKNPS